MDKKSPPKGPVRPVDSSVENVELSEEEAIYGEP